MSKAEYEYDSSGRLIRENRSYGYRETYNTTNTEYEYDDRGNKIREVCYDADGSIRYSYDRVYKTVKELSGK